MENIEAMKPVMVRIYRSIKSTNFTDEVYESGWVYSKAFDKIQIINDGVNIWNVVFDLPYIDIPFANELQIYFFSSKSIPTWLKRWRLWF